MAYTLCIIERKSIFTVLFVSVEVLLRHKKPDQVDYVREITEVFLKAALEVDVVLTCYIIAVNNVRKELGA